MVGLGRVECYRPMLGLCVLAVLFFTVSLSWLSGICVQSFSMWLRI